MSGELFTRVLINEKERKEIESAITIMNEITNAYRKTGSESVGLLIHNLNWSISILKGILDGVYY